MGAHVALKSVYTPFSIDGAFPDEQAAYPIGTNFAESFNLEGTVNCVHR